MRAAWFLLAVSCPLLADSWSCINFSNSQTPYPQTIPATIVCQPGGTCSQSVSYNPSAYSQQNGATVWTPTPTVVTATGTGAWAEGQLRPKYPTFTPTLQGGGIAPSGYASGQSWYVSVVSYVLKGTPQGESTSTVLTQQAPQSSIPASCNCFSADCSNPTAAKQCTTTCALCQQTFPAPPPSSCCGGSGGEGGLDCSQVPVWVQSQCSYECEKASPIILDIDGLGYHMTNAAGGVLFDFGGNGSKIQMSWTAAGSTNAFLVLDRNGNGTIDDGKELFGNLTPQPPCAGGRNGFAALAEFDKPENGGNGDGIIDEHDAVFAKLRLWQDLNHDGISQPEELFTMPALGVRAISLTFAEAPYVDKWGNRFRYKAQVFGTKDSSLGRIAYDVFFMVQ